MCSSHISSTSSAAGHVRVGVLALAGARAYECVCCERCGVRPGSPAAMRVVSGEASSTQAGLAGVWRDMVFMKNKTKDGVFEV